MKHAPIIPILAVITACQGTGEVAAEALVDTVLTNAPAVADNIGAFATIATGNPAIGAAVGATSAGILALIIAHKNKKARSGADK